MPGGDGRGPLGEGPMTGRGLGYCKGNKSTENPEFPYFPRRMGRRARNRAFRCGGGFGYGRANR